MKTKELDFVKFKNFLHQKDTIWRVKDNPQNEWKYLQISYLIRGNIQNRTPAIQQQSPTSTTKRHAKTGKELE